MSHLHSIYKENFKEKKINILKETGTELSGRFEELTEQIADVVHIVEEAEKVEKNVLKSAQKSTNMKEILLD